MENLNIEAPLLALNIVEIISNIIMFHGDF
jgi:hypothetical protein